jgi:hypothetical protein
MRGGGEVGGDGTLAGLDGGKEAAGELGAGGGDGLHVGGVGIGGFGGAMASV